MLLVKIYGIIRYDEPARAAIPVHLPKPNSKVRRHYFPAQTEQLRALRAMACSLVTKGDTCE
jgi:hypothetical protein